MKWWVMGAALAVAGGARPGELAAQNAARIGVSARVEAAVVPGEAERGARREVARVLAAFSDRRALPEWEQTVGDGLVAVAVDRVPLDPSGAPVRITVSFPAN